LIPLLLSNIQQPALWKRLVALHFHLFLALTHCYTYENVRINRFLLWKTSEVNRSNICQHKTQLIYVFESVLIPYVATKIYMCIIRNDMLHSDILLEHRDFTSWGDLEIQHHQSKGNIRTYTR